MPTSSSSLRLSLRNQRRALSLSTRQHFDDNIHQTLLSSAILLRFSSIAGYLSNNGEPSINAFMQHSCRVNRPFYLPVLNKQSLVFAHYKWGEQLINNRFNIPEPIAEHRFPAKFLSVVLMPLVAFDSQGNRMGMGGGYYDRTLAFMRHATCKKKPLLIGIAYSLQEVDRLVSQPWDIPLDAVITEKGLIAFSIKAKQLLRI